MRLRRGSFLHAATMSLLAVNLDERERGVGGCGVGCNLGAD